jgi:Kef-type K+ transport system membrane component KefB
MFNSALLLLQLATIIGTARMVGWIFRKFGQPQVIGEMVAGIVLGPTIIGSFAPSLSRLLFPPASLDFLTALSNVGLVIFLFLMGIRVDLADLRRQSRLVVVISNISVILPLIMGMLLAVYLFPRYGAGDRLAFMLFIGTAMSVTAFPVLARILIERNLVATRVGSVAIACAAVDDITAWTLLAMIVALLKRSGEQRPFWLTLVGVAAYLTTMLALGWLLRRGSKRISDRKLPGDAMPLFLILAFASAAAAEWIGIHALVGALIAGLITPQRFRAQLIEKLETVTLVVLTPLFFALSGLRTNLTLGAGSGAWLDLVLILIIAFASKWGGATLGARSQGLPWPEACELGLLMNTRGMVELIVLNVGLESGILSRQLFSMMVWMALVTTLMTAPLMDLFARGKAMITPVSAPIR